MSEGCEACGVSGVEMCPPCRERGSGPPDFNVVSAQLLILAIGMRAEGQDAVAGAIIHCVQEFMGVKFEGPDDFEAFIKARIPKDAP